MRKSYLTDVSDKEWALLEPLFSPQDAETHYGESNYLPDRL